MKAQKNLINKIEAILFQKAIKMNAPSLEMDLSVLVFQATYYRYSKIEEYKEKAQLLLKRFIKNFSNIDYKSGFLEGFPGVIWVVNYLKKCNIIEDNSLLDHLYPHLIQSLEIDLKYNYFESFHGSINKLYFIINSNKFREIQVKSLIDEFIDTLYTNRIENKERIYWFDPVIGENDEFTTDRYINLGIPHGLPGVLIFLVKLKDMEIQHEKLDILIQGILKTIFDSKNEVVQESHFPSSIDILNLNKNYYSSSRLAYCYGDLGIAYAVLYTSKVLNKPELKKEIKSTIDSLKRRLITDSSIDVYEDYFFLDTAFCHGLSGIVYMFNKINELLDDKEFEKRTTYWTSELLHNLERQLAITPPIYYPDYKQPTDEKEEKYNIDEQSILAGYSGTGLVLLSLFYNKYDWSDFFMLY